MMDKIMFMKAVDQDATHVYVTDDSTYLKACMIMWYINIYFLIYIYLIGQQGKTYIKAFDLRLEAVQHNTYNITIYNISAQI